MDFENVLTLIQKELRDAFRNRWFLLYAIAFAALSLALAWFSVSGAGSFGVAGFGRTTAGLINLIPVSYTHLDVYKRQAPASCAITCSPITTSPSRWNTWRA